MPIEIREEDWGATQWSWIKSDAPYSLLSGGFGSGKSSAGIAKILRLKCANGARPGLVIAQTYGALFSNLIDPMMETMRACLETRLVPTLHGRTSGAPYLQFSDGCKVHLRSAEHPKSYDGLTVAWLYGDELRHWSRKAYEIAISRVRIKDAPLIQRAFTSTPEMHWMSEEFNTDKPNRELMTCGTIENAKNLPPDYIENLRLSYSPRLQKAVLDGRFTILEGAVYDQLDPDFWSSPWVVDFDPAQNRHCKTYLAIDPGYRKSAWIWVAQTDELEWVVFDEIMPEERSDAACVEMVDARGWPIDELWTDPAADSTQSALSLDTIAMVKTIKTRGNAPVRYISGPFRSIQFGVDKVRTALGDPANGLPIRIKFARRLEAIERGQRRGIVKDLLAYRYPEAKEGHRLTAEPLKDGITDHANDAFRYWVVGIWLTSGLRRLDTARIAELAKGKTGFHQAA